MTQVRVQFFTTLDGEITRERFNASGGSIWTEDPPLTINSSVASEGIAELKDRSTVDATYWRNSGDVTFFVTVTATKDKVTALASANKEGFKATAHVSGESPNWVVGVNFN